MGELIRFPIERRQPKPQALAAQVVTGPGVEMKLTKVNGLPVEYVNGAYWFGVRLRPE